MKKYPIKINNDTIAIISIYEKEHNLQESRIFDLIEKDDDKNTSQFAAQEFIRQLKDEWNGIFMESLIIECVKEYKQYWVGLSKEKQDEKLNESIEKLKEL